MLLAREFCFGAVQVWFAKCRIAIGTTSIHYPFRAATNIQGVTSIIHSPRKGTHKPVKITVDQRNSYVVENVQFIPLSNAANAVILNRLSNFADRLLATTVGIRSIRDIYWTCQAAKAPGWAVKVAAKVR